VTLGRLQVHTVALARMARIEGCTCGPLTPCMVKAKTEAEVLACIKPGCGGCAEGPSGLAGLEWIVVFVGALGIRMARNARKPSRGVGARTALTHRSVRG
jgi:hypothetical protein